MRKKKIELMMIIASCAAVALTGCGQKSDKSDKTVNNGADNSFTYWMEMDASAASRVQSMGELEIYKEAERQTGVHIEFVHPPLGQADEQFNLMIASQEMMDFVEHKWMRYPGGPGKAINDGVIIPLNDYIDGVAVNFKKVINSDDELSAIYKKGSTTDDGKCFAFPSLNTGKYRTFGGIMIRKDWLDELNMPVPETIDEWTEVLRAFKEKKGATAPLTSVPGYFLTGGFSFEGAYGIGKTLYLDGDKVKFGIVEPTFKDYLTQMNSWYKEGLLDNGFATADKKIVASNITKGVSGATISFIGSGMGQYMNQMKSDLKYNIVAAPYPTLKKGDVNPFMQTEGDVTTTNLAISGGCKNPEAAAKWADFWYSDAGYKLLNFGVEGISYNMENNKPVYTDLILKNPDGLSISEALGMYTRATGPAPGLNQAQEYLEQYYQLPQQAEALKIWSDHVDEAREVTLPSALIPTEDEMEEVSALETNINTYCEEMVMKFIMGEESLDNYDSFVQELKDTFSLERYIEIKQAEYDRYLKR